MTEKAYCDPVVGAVRIRRKANVRRISLRVASAEELILTLPWLVPLREGLRFLESRREWVLRTRKRQAQREAEYARTTDPIPENGDMEAWIEGLRAEAKRVLPERLESLARRYGYSYNKVTIKHNRSNWGSCSTRGNINLNLNLMRLPGLLQDYVMLHELTHLREMNHGPRFHEALERVCADHYGTLRDAGDTYACSLPQGIPSVHRYLSLALKAWRLM